MNLAGLTTAYTLSRLKVSPNDLLLDPRNPRLITESVQDRTFSTADIRTRETQEYVRDLVCRREHDVKRLIASIEQMGFVGGLHEMIVKDVGKGGPYLVIEGNRRTAALQHLLSCGRALRPEVRKSIEEIEVKQFVFRAHEGFTEETVIDVLLGSIHIDGPKEWGALERANYVHRTYLREFGERSSFRYSLNAAKAAGARFKLSPKAVHKYLKICRVYEQLRRAKVGIEPKHYTLIELATKTRAVAGPYFELDGDTCIFSESGVERFVELIVRENAPIHNPKLFNDFVEVFENGSALELKEVSDGAASLEATCTAIRRRVQRREFRDELEDIRRSVGGLFVDGFRGTEGEKALIRKIKQLVDGRLLPLTRS